MAVHTCSAPTPGFHFIMETFYYLFLLVDCFSLLYSFLLKSATNEPSGQSSLTNKITNENGSHCGGDGERSFGPRDPYFITLQNTRKCLQATSLLQKPFQLVNLFHLIHLNSVGGLSLPLLASSSTN